MILKQRRGATMSHFYRQWRQDDFCGEGLADF